MSTVTIPPDTSLFESTCKRETFGRENRLKDRKQIILYRERRGNKRMKNGTHEL
jgi:hypothetical protein